MFSLFRSLFRHVTLLHPSQVYTLQSLGAEARSFFLMDLINLAWPWKVHSTYITTRLFFVPSETWELQIPLIIVFHWQYVFLKNSVHPVRRSVLFLSELVFLTLNTVFFTDLATFFWESRERRGFIKIWF